MTTENNIILTGPPRSGTTLACHLLNKTDNTVALHEPMSLQMFSDRQTVFSVISGFFNEMRKSLLDSGTAISKVKEGVIPDNPFGNESSSERISEVKKSEVRFDKHLTPDFRLIIKHNGHFTFLLPELLKYFPVYIIIRDPVSTIASWNTVDAPVAKGNLKVLKYLDPDLYNLLEKIPDILDRQVRLLDEMYKRYELSAEATIIRYEDIVSGGGKALAPVSPAAKSLNEPLSSKNRNPIYGSELPSSIKDRLKKAGGYFEKYYPIK